MASNLEKEIFADIRYKNGSSLRELVSPDIKLLVRKSLSGVGVQVWSRVGVKIRDSIWRLEPIEVDE